MGTAFTGPDRLSLRQADHIQRTEADTFPTGYTAVCGIEIPDWLHFIIPEGIDRKCDQDFKKPHMPGLEPGSPANPIRQGRNPGMRAKNSLLDFFPAQLRIAVITDIITKRNNIW